MNTLPFRNVLNFRDLGGYPTLDGRTVPYNTFYRTGNLSALNEEERAYFETLGIRFILDLRTAGESQSDPDPVFEGTEYLRHSGVQSKGGEEIDFSPKGMRQIGKDGKRQLEQLTEYYRNMPFHNGAMRILSQYVASYKVPILFHCASGKDRTGVGAMLVLLLLGVDEETVVSDYLLSNLYRKELIEEEKERSRELIANDPSMEKLILMLPGVNEDIMRSVLSSIKERYGSYENYFKEEHGISSEKLQEIRDHYLKS